MTANRQRGAALITALVFLIVLTLVAVSSVQNVNLQQNMTSAVRQGYVALEVAENGLREAEDHLMGFATQGAFSAQNVPGLYENGEAKDPWSMNWDDSDSISGDNVTIGGKTFETRYIIEHIGPMNEQEDLGQITTGNVQNSMGVNIGYRIVARGVGNDGVTERIVEAYIARIF